MPASLITGLCPDYPVNIVRTIDNAVLISNGIDSVRRWDGITASGEEAGMEYSGSSGPSVTPGAGGSVTAGVHQCGFRWLDRNRLPSNISYISPVTISTNHTISWTSYLPAGGTAARATIVQLFRSLANAPGVLYLVHEEAISGSSGTYSDTLSDTTLMANLPLVVTNDDLSTPAEAYRRGQPPWHMSAIIPHLGRMYAAVPVPYKIGHCEVTNGSTVVSGVGTNWSAGFNPNTYLNPGGQFDRSFRVIGDTAEYGIDPVQPVTANKLSLTASYAGTTNKFAPYVIYAPDTELLKIYYTAAGEPESWPVEYSVICKPEGGAITALILAGSQMYIAKRSKLFTFTVNVDPAIDGAVWPADEARGCENQRTWVSAEGAAYIMDRQGIYAWDGGKPRDVSEQIGDLFKYGKINWRQSRWFRAVYDQERSTVRFFVCLAGSIYARHALCYSLRTGSWWHEEQECGVGSATVLNMGGRRRLVLGTDKAKIQVAGDSNLDGVVNETTSTLRGNVTSGSLFKITDSTAAFTSEIVGTYVAIVDGRGKGQRKTITSVTSTDINVKEPFIPAPDSSSVYQVGGFKAEWIGPQLRYTQRPADTTREVMIAYRPSESPSHLFGEVYLNWNENPKQWGSAFDDPGTDVDVQDGVIRRGQDPSLFVNLYRKQSSQATPDSDTFDDEGFRRFSFDGHTDVKGSSDRWMTLGLWTHGCADGVNIFELAIDGVRG